MVSLPSVAVSADNDGKALYSRTYHAYVYMYKGTERVADAVVDTLSADWSANAGGLKWKASGNCVDIVVTAGVSVYDVVNSVYIHSDALNTDIKVSISVGVSRQGMPGTGSIYMDLDNENDSILYDGQGNRVSSPCVSGVTLYANGADKTSDIVGNLKVKCSEGVTASLSGRVLTVSGCTKNSGYALVSCTYGGLTYAARFTVKRLSGTDKYDIVCTPAAVTFNASTDSAQSTTVKVKVYRTAQNGATVLLSALPSGFKLKRWWNDKTGSVDMTSDYKSGEVSFIPLTSNYNYRVELTDASGALLDYETIPMVRFKNGDKGDDAVVYQVRPSLSALAFTMDSSDNLTPASYSLDCGYVKTVGDVQKVVASCINSSSSPVDGLYRIYYRYLPSSGEWSAWSAYSSASKVYSTTSFSAYEFCMSSASAGTSVADTNIVSRQTVPITKSGATGAKGADGLAGALMRNRGRFTPSAIKTDGVVIYNSSSWVDYLTYVPGDGTSYRYKLADTVEKWTPGGYYTKAAPTTLVKGSFLPASGSSVWARFSELKETAASFIIASGMSAESVSTCEAFIGDTGASLNDDGTVSINGASGWAITGGQIRHTKTGLSLTADGYLDNPDGLHLSVSGKPTNAVLPPSANMLPDPILNNPRHFGFDEGSQSIPVDSIGTTSPDEFWATSLVQTGSKSTFLNFTSPWADDGGRVVSIHFGAEYVPSQSKYVYTGYVKSNRVAILTSIPLDGSSDMKQRNIYTFSVWAKNASSDFLFNSLAEARVFVSALGEECSWLYLGIERSASNGGVRTIASGIASEIEGWVQYYVTFEVVFGSSAQSGSAAYADKAYFDWMPYVNAKKKNMYVSYAGAKLEKGDKPTPMTYLSGSLKRAGIDISNGEVVLTADKFLCQNLEGEKTAWLDDTGVFIANGVFTSPVNIIDWDNNVGCDKIIVAFKDADGNFIGYLDNDGNYRLMSGDISDKDEWVIKETVVYLDVLRLGDTVKILSLPAVAIGSGGSDLRFFEFPYYIDGELNCRTLTRLNGKSDSVPRLITGDEMRMLGGKRITLLLKDAVPTPYTLAQCFFLSYASSYMSPDLQTANATYVYQYPHGGMIYDGSSGMKLNGDRVVTLECRAAFFYDVKAVGSGNKSCYGYAWVSSRDETISQFGNSLDNWN